MSPVEPKGLTDASAGVEQEDHQGTQVFIAGVDQTTGLLRGDPANPSWRLLSGAP